MRPLFAAACLFSCLSVACQSGPPHPAPLTVAAAQYDHALEAAAATLRAHGLRVARLDRRMGVVAAFPEGIPASAEWWHGNAPNGGDWEARADLQDLRHVARIQIAPGTDGHYALSVEVTVERLDRPTRRVTAAAWNPASNLSEVPGHWQARGVRDYLWQKIGRDATLEAQLMKGVTARLPDR